LITKLVLFPFIFGSYNYVSLRTDLKRRYTLIVLILWYFKLIVIYYSCVIFYWLETYRSVRVMLSVIKLDMTEPWPPKLIQIVNSWSRLLFYIYHWKTIYLKDLILLIAQNNICVLVLRDMGGRAGKVHVDDFWQQP